MYIFIFLIISIISYLQIKYKKSGINKTYILIWILLTLMLCFRYGQGTDYYGYSLQFESIDTSLSYLTNTLYHGEIGWYILLLVLKKIGLSFGLFICLLSVVMMLSLHHCLKKYNKFPILSILLFFPTYYLTYCYSALRQGLVLCLFLGFGLNWLLERKHKYYFILCLILSLLHKSSLILLIMPLIINIKIRLPFVALFIACTSSFALSKANFMLELSDIFTDGNYMKESYSIGAIAMRFLLFYIIYRIHKFNSFNNKIENELYNLYTWGSIIFMALSFSGNLSQRLTVPFKAIEIILIPLLIYNAKKKALLSIKKNILPIVSFIILLMNIELYKNLYSYIEQGQYYTWVTPITYPYISVFNANEIVKYRTYFDESIW